MSLLRNLLHPTNCLQNRSCLFVSRTIHHGTPLNPYKLHFLPFEAVCEIGCSNGERDNALKIQSVIHVRVHRIRITAEIEARGPEPGLSRCTFSRGQPEESLQERPNLSGSFVFGVDHGLASVPPRDGHGGKSENRGKPWKTVSPGAPRQAGWRRRRRSWLGGPPCYILWHGPGYFVCRQENPSRRH